MFPTRIETERLVFVPRSPTAVDPLDFYEVCSAPSMEEVTEHMPWDPHDTPKESRDALERGRETFEARETAEYVLRVDGDIAGQTGLKFDWERDRAELVLWLRRRYWGRGFSGERAAALAALAFDHLDVELLTVGHVVDNEQSRRAVEKYVDRFGGRREGVKRNAVPFPDGEMRDEVRYSVSRAEWAESGVDPDVTFEW